MENVVKTRGKIYTPNYIVKNVCDLANYTIGKINKKHVIDNSCGDGAFLIEIVERYINDFFIYSNDLIELKRQIETYIHGIELDEAECKICCRNLNDVCESYGLFNVKFDVVCNNTLNIFENYKDKMDFVLGNPPYVRVHNFGNNYDQLKSFNFSQGGMTDLYLIFYEIGIKMLNKNGRLSYIAPSSFFTSLAGKNFREWIISSNKVESVCDLKHFQPFNATTYTAIITIDNSKKSEAVYYYEYDAHALKTILISLIMNHNFLINGNFYFATELVLSELKEILTFIPFGSNVFVKNGFATLADKVFIGNFDFESKYIIDILKISTSQWYKAIFPYNKHGKLISLDDLEKDKNLYEYLLSKKEMLLRRDIDYSSSWFGYGRTQAINDMVYDRIAINTLFKTTKDIKLNFLPAGVGAYSGLYIISNFSYEQIKEAVISEKFLRYISLLGKYKSGGYYTCSSKDVKQYLDFYFYSDSIKDK